MVIEEKDFRLEQISDDSNFWDLNLLRVKKKRDGSIVEEFGDTIYGITLEHAIKRIISNRISRKNPESVDMKTYLKLWSEEMKNVNGLCQSPSMKI